MPRRRPPVAEKMRGLSASKRSDMLRYLMLGEKKDWIADVLKISTRSVQRYARHLLMFGDMAGPPRIRRDGRPSKITVADGDALLDHMLDFGWLDHNEMTAWLNVERGTLISVSSTKRLVKKRGWSRVTLRTHAAQPTLIT